MKKLLFLLLAAAALLTAGDASARTKKPVAPEDKGWWLGGEIGLWHNTVEEIDTNSFVFSPPQSSDFRMGRNLYMVFALCVQWICKDMDFFGLRSVVSRNRKFSLNLHNLEP